MSNTGVVGSIQPQRESQVNGQMGTLKDVMTGIEQQVKELEVRLSGVAKAAIPEPGDKAGAEEVLVPLANDIRQFVYRAKSIARTLTSLIERIEV